MLSILAAFDISRRVRETLSPCCRRRPMLLSRKGVEEPAPFEKDELGGLQSPIVRSVIVSSTKPGTVAYHLRLWREELKREIVRILW